MHPSNGKTFLVSAGAFLLIPILLGQTPQAPRGSGIPDGGTREVLVSIFIPSLPNAAFTATLNTEWVRFLADGTRITLRNHRLIARDKSGRIFQERRLLVPEGGEQHSVITQTEISDPNAKEQYICAPRERVCQLEVFHALSPIGSAAGRPPEAALGTKSIAGVEAVGTRETKMIPMGTIGNSSPIRTTMEYWYSQRLGFNALSIREDPRFGTQKFELSDVVMADPDPNLFAPPEGSQIIDLRNLVVGAPGK